MRCNHSKQVFAQVSKLLFLLLPVAGFCQEKKGAGKLPWSYHYVQKAARIPAVQEALMDSVKQKLALLRQVQATDSAAGKRSSQAARALQDRLSVLSAIDTDPSSILSRLPALYSLKTALPATFKDPFSLSVGEIQGQAVYGSSYGTNDPLQEEPGQLYRLAAQASAQVAGVPFAGAFQWGYPSFFDQSVHGTYKVSFDREAYLSGLRKKLTDHFDIGKVVLQDFDFQKLFKTYAQNQISSFKEKLIGPGSPAILASRLGQLSADELLFLEKGQLAEKLLPRAWVDSLTDARAALQGQLANSRHSADSSTLLNTIASIEGQLQKGQQQLEQLLALKKTFETDGLNYNQLVRYQQGVNSGLKEITGSEAFVQEASKNLLPLKGLSRLFLHVQELNIGQFASSWNKGALSDQFLSGVGGSFLNKGKFLGVNLSQVQTLGWLKDNPFATALYEPASSLQAMRLGRGKPGEAHAHLSMLNASTRPQNNLGNPYSFLPRNTFVGSYSQALSLGSLGSVDAEVSKSASQYRNTLSADNRLESGIALKHMGTDFWQTLAVGLRYEGDFESIDFRPKVFASYAGLGYTNPGSSLQSRGSLSYGAQLQKKFFQNRLGLQTRFSKRTNRTALEEHRRLNQWQQTLAANYRINKKIKLGVNWNYSDLSRTNKDSSSRLYSSNRLSTDFSMNTRLAGYPLYHYTGLGFQKLSVPDLSVPGFGNMLWFNSASSLALAKGTVSANLQLLSNLDPSARAGALLTSDIGWTYVVLKKVNITTAFNYLDQKVSARQLGLRNTISIATGGGLGLQLFADFRKDLVENQNELLFPRTRGEATITYNLK